MVHRMMVVFVQPDPLGVPWQLPWWLAVATVVMGWSLNLTSTTLQYIALQVGWDSEGISFKYLQ